MANSSKRLSCAVAAALALCLAASGALADWPNSVLKWDQFTPGADAYGLASYFDDVNGDAMTADDFLCTHPGPIADIRFAGFAPYGADYIQTFRLTFFTDTPATGTDASQPGDLIYDQIVAKASPSDPLLLGWQNLGSGQFRINLPQDQWFYQEGTQEAPRVYWIGIQAVMAYDGYGDLFYWSAVQRSLPTWGDDAAFASQYYGYQPWAHWGWKTVDPQTGAPDLYSGLLPADWVKSVDAVFEVRTPEPASMALLALGAVALVRRRARRAAA